MADRPRPTIDRERVDQFCECLRKVLDEKLGGGADLPAEGIGQGKTVESVCGPPAPFPAPLIQPVETVGKCEFILTGDEKTDVELRNWLQGKAKPTPGVEVAEYLKRDRVLRPSLEAELDRLRTVLDKEAPGQPGGILITYRDDSRTLELNGYSDAYHGSTWVLKLTPNYTEQNQAEIAAYVRANEDAIVEAVRGLVPRRRRGHLIAFYQSHPGVNAARFENVPGKTYQEPVYHPEDG